MTPKALKRALYAAAHAPEQREELSKAVLAWFEGEPQEEGWPDFIDFFALEWVGQQGQTLLETVVGDPLTIQARQWLTGVRNGVFVVDAMAGDVAFCRDAATEEDLAVVVGEALAPGSVLRGRLLPEGQGRFQVSGDPDVYGPLPIIERMRLVQNWLNSPRRALCEWLAGLRAGFLRQREQRQAFLAFFGGDQLLFPNTLEMEQHLNGFLEHLLHRYLPPGLGGRTFAEDHQLTTGEPAVQVKVELSPSLLQAGAVGVLYDATEGIHFLPAFDAFVDHLQGRAEHPEVVRRYLQDPGISALPFLRVGGADRLAELLGVPMAPMAELLAPHKAMEPRPAPSVLPHFDG